MKRQSELNLKVRRVVSVCSAVMLLCLPLMLGGCNIVDGVGREITAIGKGVSAVTNDVHPYKEASAGR